MASVLVVKLRNALLVSILAQGLLSPFGASKAAAAEAWPAQVRATYKIEFNGFDVGSFDFTADVNGRFYSLTGDAKISALLGIISWKGGTRTSGALAGDAPRPVNYAFDFNGAGKAGAVRMNYTGDAVSNIAQSPPLELTPEIVPVREAHLKGALDPLSAVMALSRSAGANPCGRKLAIFDGRQRFDIVLAYQRQERVTEAKPSGQPGVAYVCRVRYVPIAGHRVGEESQGLAINQGIEISLRPIPSANLFIPHQITIPTSAGKAILTSQSVEIITPQNEQIALSN
jgi:hypothetical protein